MNRQWRWTLLLLVLILPGCYSQYDDGTTLTIKMALWIRALTVLVPLAGFAILGGLCFLPKSRPTLRTVVRILAIIGIVLFLFPVVCCAPSASWDSVEVSPERLRRVTGFWFAPTVAEVRWAEVEAFEMMPDSREGPFPGRLWYARLKSGARVRIPPGDLGAAAEVPIRSKIESLGIRVEFTP